MTTQIVGWAVIHSLWQGALIAAAAAVFLAVTRHRSPAIRYIAGYAALVAMVVLPLATAWQSRESVEKRSSSAVTQVDFAGGPATESEVSAAPEVPLASAPQSQVISTSLSDYVTVSPAATNLIAFAWILGLLVASLRLTGGLLRTRRLTRVGVSPARDSLVRATAALANRLGIGRTLRVLESVRIDVPFTVGVVKPVVVVPVSILAGIAPWQVEMLLAHELAHIRRYDFLANLLQTVIETLLFYHPAARWLSDRVRDERENCCDDMAVAISGGDPRAYTETLLALEESRIGDAHLAAAADGGSLLRRTRRLLSAGRTHLELGPRWIAGVVTLAAALLTGREAMGSGVRASIVPAFVEAEEPAQPAQEQHGDPDPRRAAPSRTERAPSGASLADRVRWASQRAAAAGENLYWVGYVVAGRGGTSRFYSDEIPVRIGKSTMLSGQMQLNDDGDLSEFRFFGVPLQPLVGPYGPRSSAIFLLIDRQSGAIERVRSATFELPVYFDRRPVFWLDSASDAESVELLRSMSTRIRQSSRSALVGAVGIHSDAQLVAPVLVSWLRDSGQSEEVRSQSAEWLGRHSAIAELSRTARTDRSKQVRHSAIEAFAHMSDPAAVDSLIAFASTMPYEDDRRTAIEALGHRKEERALDHIVRTARSDRSAEIRGHAMESISMTEKGERALAILEDLVRRETDDDVRVQGVEAISQVRDARSVAILRRFATSGFSIEVQRAAVEALGSTVDNRAALAALREIAQSHPSDAVRAQAYETIAALRSK